MPDRISWLTACWQRPSCATQTRYTDEKVHLRATCRAPLSGLALCQRAANPNGAPRSVRWPQEPEEALLIQRVNEFVNGLDADGEVVPQRHVTAGRSTLLGNFEVHCGQQRVSMEAHGMSGDSAATGCWQHLIQWIAKMGTQRFNASTKYESWKQ